MDYLSATASDTGCHVLEKTLQETAKEQLLVHGAGLGLAIKMLAILKRTKIIEEVVMLEAGFALWGKYRRGEGVETC